MRKRIGAAVIFTILLFFMFSSITVFGKLKKNVGKGYDLLDETEVDIDYTFENNATVLIKGKAKTKKGSYTYSLNNGKLRIKNTYMFMIMNQIRHINTGIAIVKGVIYHLSIRKFIFVWTNSINYQGVFLLSLI